MEKFKNKWVKWPAILVIILLFGWFNRYKFTKYYYMHVFFRNSPERMIKNHEKTLSEDREILSKYALFYPSRGTKDAGPYLNSMIHWEIGPIHHQGSLVLPEFVHKEMNKDWVTKKPLFKKMGLKFDWMKKLQEFDYWSPDENSPAFPPGRTYQTYSFPVPTYKDLMTWAKLRYLYGTETGDIQGALKDVRHLMRLIWTNDYLVSSMVVVSMLKIENQFEEILTPKEMGDWKFIPHEDVMRAKRYFYSLPTVADIRIYDDTWERVTKTNTGLCHMLTESMMGYIAMRDFLAEELKYGFKRLDQKIKDSPCRRTYLHKLWDDPNWKTHATLEGLTVLGKSVGFEDVYSNPDLKATVGFMLSGVAGPGYFQYGKDSN